MADQIEDVGEIFSNNNLMTGRMISGSKSGYHKMHPDSDVVFNANIFILGEGKIWHGDLDITLDKEKLESVAAKIGKSLYILREMDGRFENEELPDSKIIEKAHAKINP